jgi:hypothetical protein
MFIESLAHEWAAVIAAWQVSISYASNKGQNAHVILFNKLAI